MHQLAEILPGGQGNLIMDEESPPGGQRHYLVIMDARMCFGRFSEINILAVIQLFVVLTSIHVHEGPFPSHPGVQSSRSPPAHHRLTLELPCWQLEPPLSDVHLFSDEQVLG
jgi:hypothetical protein